MSVSVMGGFSELIKQLQVAQTKINELRTIFDQLAGSSEIDAEGLRPPIPTPNVERLTETEREILTHVARGRSNLEIAKIMGISKRTVETHRSNMCRKLGLTPRELREFAANQAK